MSEPKFTPGPWKPGRTDMQSYDGITGQPFASVYADDERAGEHLGHRLPLLVARIPGDAIGADEAHANAALISAAPELLEIAARLVRQWDEFRTWDQGDWRAVLSVGRSVYDQAMAALAKARGEP